MPPPPTITSLPPLPRITSRPGRRRAAGRCRAGRRPHRYPRLGEGEVGATAGVDAVIAVQRPQRGRGRRARAGGRGRRCREACSPCDRRAARARPRRATGFGPGRGARVRPRDRTCGGSPGVLEMVVRDRAAVGSQAGAGAGGAQVGDRRPAAGGEADVERRVVVEAEHVAVAVGVDRGLGRVLAPAVGEQATLGVGERGSVAPLHVAVEPADRVPGGHVDSAQGRGAERDRHRGAGDEGELVVSAAADHDLGRVDPGQPVGREGDALGGSQRIGGVGVLGEAVVGRHPQRRLGDRRRCPGGRGRRAEGSGSGGTQVVPADDRVDPGVLLADERDPAGAERVAGDPDSLRIDQRRERVLAGVQPGGHAPVLLGGVAGADAAVGVAAGEARAVGVGRRRKQEVERVLGAVVEGLAALGGDALLLVDALAEGVGAALTLDVVGEDHVTVLGQRRGEAPVEGLGCLHGAGRDHDPRPPRRTLAGSPDVARDRRPAAGREQDRRDGAVLLAPVIEADVAGALVLAVGADVGDRIALRVGGEQLRVLDEVAHVLLCQQELELGREGDVLVALVDLREVARLLGGVEAKRDRGQRQGDADGADRSDRDSPRLAHQRFWLPSQPDAGP